MAPATKASESSSSSTSKSPEPEATEPQAPEDNAPAPEAPTEVVIQIPEPPDPEDSKPVDRATYVGAANVRDPDVKVPDDYAVPEGEFSGEPVEVFQVVSTNGALALRVGGDTILFNSEQARALSKDVSAALLNVTT